MKARLWAYLNSTQQSIVKYETFQFCKPKTKSKTKSHLIKSRQNQSARLATWNWLVQRADCCSVWRKARLTDIFQSSYNLVLYLLRLHCLSSCFPPQFHSCNLSFHVGTQRMKRTLQYQSCRYTGKYRGYFVKSQVISPSSRSDTSTLWRAACACNVYHLAIN